MKFAYCYTGANVPAIKEFDIESTANVEKGQVVCAQGNVVTETVKGAKLIGVCEETHTGKEDLLNTRSNGTKIRVNVTDGVYQAQAIKLVAENGCTDNTFVCNAEGLSDACVGGVLVNVKNANASARKIIGFSVNADKATLSVENGETASEGDVYAIIPALGATVKLDKEKTGYSFNNTDTDVELCCVGFDVDRLNVYVKLKNTIFA